MTDARIDIKVSETGARRVKRDLKDLGREGDKTTGSVKRLSQAFVALGGALAVGQFARFTDSITRLTTQLNNVTDSAAQSERVFSRLFSIAQETGTSINDLSGIYSKLNISLTDTIKDQTDLVKVTEVLSKSFAANGQSAQEVQGALTQLSQGLASNFQASAEELNSIIDGAPLLARIISEKLGGEAAIDLKKFAEEGRLTARSFLDATLAAEEAVNAFSIPNEISRGFVRVRNTMVALGRESTALKSVSNAVANSLTLLAENLETVFKVMQAIIITAIPRFLSAFSVSIPAAIAATTTAFNALTAAILANPIGALGTVIAATIGTLFAFREEILEAARDVTIGGKQITDIFFSLRGTAIATFKNIGDIILTPFRNLNTILKKTVAELIQIANKVPGVNFGNDAQTRRLANTSLSQLLAEDNAVLGRVVEQADTIAARSIADFSKKAEKVGLTDAAEKTKPINITLDKVDTQVEEVTKQVVKLDGEIGRVGDSIKNAFVDGFRDGIGSLNRLVAGARNAFNEFAGSTIARVGGRVATAAGGAALGGLGFTTSAQASGGMGLSSLSSLGSLFNTGPITLGGLVPGGIGSSLGFAQPLAAGVQGPIQAGSIFGGTTLSGALAGGAVGGLGAQLLGLGSGNAIVDTGTSLAGTAIGAALGGPVGAAIGSFLGTSLGGLFGGSKPSDKAQGAFVDFASGNIRTDGQTGDKFSQENRDFVDRTADELKNLASAIKAAGGEIAGGVKLVVGSRDGLRVDGRNFGANPQAFLRGANQALLNRVTGGSQNLQTALSNVNAGDSRAIAEAVGLVQLIDSFNDAGEAAKPLQDALNGLDSQFNQLKQRAQGLGLPVEQLTESYQKQKDAIIDDVLQPFSRFLDQQALGADSSFNPAQRLSLARSNFDQNLQNIQAGDFSNLGGLTGQASQLLSIGRDVFASSPQFVALENFVRSSVAGVAGDLGAPEGSLNANVARDISLSNAEQTSIMSQMSTELQELRKENTKLRKSMERVGNSLVVQS